MSDELRVGLVGCGQMGQAHLRIWQKTAGARVTAVCDGVSDRACETGEAFDAAPFTEVDEMAASGLIDAVDICSPSGLHGDQGLSAARHNLHVLCEKPLDLNVEKADRLIAECESRGLTLAVVFQRRAYPTTQRIAQEVAAGHLGRILSCSVYVKWWRPQPYYDSAAWRGSWALDCGVLSNQAIHMVDFMCWLAGPVREVEYAHLETSTHAMEAEDFAIAVLRFECGARGVIEATTCSFPDLCTRLELIGDRGSVAFDDLKVARFGYDGQDHTAALELPAMGPGGGASEPMAISMNGHELLLADFVGAVRDQRKPMVSGGEARVSVDALNKIYRKMFPNQKLGL